MATRKSTISSKVYIAFRSLPQKGWADIIKLYESKRAEIQLLSPIRQLDILHMYLESLHEVKDYPKLLNEVTEMIYGSLSDEIPVDIGRSYYEDALFWKADALMHLMEYKESQYILSQLVLMNPRKDIFKSRLTRCMYMDKPNYIRTFRAISVLLFLLAAIIVVFEILLVESFFSQFLETVELTRNTLFLVALLQLGLIEIVHWCYCEKTVRRIG